MMDPGTQVKSEEDRLRKRPAQTAEDKEIEEWAKKLKSKTTQLVPVPGQNSATLADIQHSGFDIDSAIGRFTWHTVGQDKYIPCLFRNKEKFCCVRMVEATVMGDLLNVLPQEIYDTAKLCSHFVTAAEAKLLTYINSWHCDSIYGQAAFTDKDLVVTVEEVEEFYSYLVFAYDVLSSGGQNKNGDFTRCGFVRVNNESLIPYTNLRAERDEKGVPLFYFEGQTDILKVKAKPLSGWDLAYLKICCKVQGVRKELIAGDTLNIVKLSDLKSYFPKRTVFTEKCWPPSKGKSLLPKQNYHSQSGVNHSHLNPQTVQMGQQVRLIYTQQRPQTATQKMTTTMSTTTPTTLVRGPMMMNGNSNCIISNMTFSSHNFIVNPLVNNNNNNTNNNSTMIISGSTHHHPALRNGLVTSSNNNNNGINIQFNKDRRVP